MATAGAETRSGASAGGSGGMGGAGFTGSNRSNRLGLETSGRVEFTLGNFGLKCHSAQIATIRVCKSMNIRGLGSNHRRNSAF
jgi:hypothetical protein